MYKAIIIDDEETARETIDLLVRRGNFDIEIVAKASNAEEGLKLIGKLQPSIIFLDINMPGKSGLEMLDYISTKDIQVIFTTAYDQYAIRAINLSACYYLLKPISAIELKAAIEKAIDNVKQRKDLNIGLTLLKELAAKPQAYPSKIIVSNKNIYELIDVSDIMYLEADKNYTWINKLNAKFIIAKTLKEFEEQFNPEVFFRIHQSYIINKSYAQSVHNTRPDQLELTNGLLIPIARDRKKDLMEWLSK